MNRNILLPFFSQLFSYKYIFHIQNLSPYLIEQIPLYPLQVPPAMLLPKQMLLRPLWLTWKKSSHALTHIGAVLFRYEAHCSAALHCVPPQKRDPQRPLWEPRRQRCLVWPVLALARRPHCKRPSWQRWPTLGPRVRKSRPQCGAKRATWHGNRWLSWEPPRLRPNWRTERQLIMWRQVRSVSSQSLISNQSLIRRKCYYMWVHSIINAIFEEYFPCSWLEVTTIN